MITKIQIDRFKSLRHTDWLKLGKVTLLTGANGKGKSSFCQTLLTLSQSWRRGLMDNLLPSGTWKDLGNFGNIVYAYGEDKSVGIHIKTDAERDNDFELLYRQSSDNEALGDMVSAKVGGVPITDDAGSSDNGDDSGTEIVEEDHEIRLGSLRDFPTLIALERMYYVAAERKPAPAQQQIDETTPHINLAPDGSNVLNILWKNRECGVIEKVQALLDEVLDGGGLTLDLVGDQLALKMNSVADGHYFLPVNVGYGYSYILTLLAAVALAADGSYIIVENPEAHLHPSAQARMMNVMIRAATEQNVQLIVETHSDHVLNTSLRAVNDHRLNKEDFEILFFSTNSMDENGATEAIAQNLQVNELGHILNPPRQFFEQYSQDLRALYATPTRQ